MQLRAEWADDRVGIATVVRAAFLDQADGREPVEVALVDALRADAAWIPELSLVAVIDDDIVGHVLATRGNVDGVPALGVAPLAVHPDFQRQGIGTALMVALAERSDARGESLSALLGDPAYYVRFDFVPAEVMGVQPPVPEWAPHFQVRIPAGITAPTGTFHYAAPFSDL